MTDDDRQAPPPRDGAADVLAGHVPDDIPMTGEEDPLAEVEDPDFAPIVGEFLRSERARKL